jgi:TPR repeat protein
MQITNTLLNLGSIVAEDVYKGWSLRNGKRYSHNSYESPRSACFLLSYLMVSAQTAPLVNLALKTAGIAATLPVSYSLILGAAATSVGFLAIKRRAWSVADFIILQAQPNLIKFHRIAATIAVIALVVWKVPGAPLAAAVQLLALCGSMFSDRSLFHYHTALRLTPEQIEENRLAAEKQEKSYVNNRVSNVRYAAGLSTSQENDFFKAYLKAVEQMSPERKKKARQSYSDHIKTLTRQAVALLPPGIVETTPTALAELVQFLEITDSTRNVLDPDTKAITNPSSLPDGDGQQRLREVLRFKELIRCFTVKELEFLRNSFITGKFEVEKSDFTVESEGSEEFPGEEDLDSESRQIQREQKVRERTLYKKRLRTMVSDGIRNLSQQLTSDIFAGSLKLSFSQEMHMAFGNKNRAVGDLEAAIGHYKEAAQFRSEDGIQALESLASGPQGLVSAQKALGFVYAVFYPGVWDPVPKGMQFLPKVNGNTTSDRYWIQRSPKDFVKAAKWYHEAAKKGDAEATKVLEGLVMAVLEIIRSYRFSESENLQGQYVLGVMYQQGYGVPQDNEAAISCFRLALLGKSPAQRDATSELLGLLKKGKQASVKEHNIISSISESYLEACSGPPKDAANRLQEQLKQLHDQALFDPIAQRALVVVYANAWTTSIGSMYEDYKDYKEASRFLRAAAQQKKLLPRIIDEEAPTFIDNEGKRIQPDSRLVGMSTTMSAMSGNLTESSSPTEFVTFDQPAEFIMIGNQFAANPNGFQITKANVSVCVEIGNYLGIPKLLELCEDYYLEKINTRCYNILELWNIAVKNGFARLKQSCEERMSEDLERLCCNPSPYTNMTITRGSVALLDLNGTVLSHFTLSSFLNCNIEALREILTKQSGIHSITLCLANNDHPDDEGVKAKIKESLGKILPELGQLQLYTLNLDQNIGLGDVEMGLIVKHFPLLQHLSGNILNSAVPMIGQLTHLQTLSLHGYQLTAPTNENLIALLTALPNLRSLELQYNMDTQGLNSDVLSSFVIAQNLEELKLGEMDMRGFERVPLNRMPKLQSLSLAIYPGLDGLIAIVSNPHLRRLSLSFIAEDHFHVFVGNQTIEELEIKDLFLPSDTLIPSLSQMGKLHTLCLPKSYGLNEELFRALPNLRVVKTGVKLDAHRIGQLALKFPHIKFCYYEAV